MAGSRKEYGMEFQLNATLNSSYNSAFSKAQAKIADMQSEILSLNNVQKDISAYQKQQSALEATSQKLSLLEQEYQNIQREINETEGFSSALENRLLSKQKQIDKTKQSIDAKTQSLEKMGASLQDAGVDLEDLTGASSRLENAMDDLKQAQTRVADEAENMGLSGMEAIEAYQKSIVASSIQESLREIYDEFHACAEASTEFESAITGVYKTVDGTDEELAAITREVKELATEIPSTTDEIAAVAEAAGQLGIAQEDVMEFTRVMIDLGESTNLASEEAASSLAKFTNITGTAAENYSRLGSVIVGLGNNFATTEADIVAMGTRLASAGELAGLTEPEILALAAAMSSVGIEAEAGGTAMTQTFSAIETAVAGGGDTLDEFARIAGMSAEEFATAWETSPINAIQAFIAGIGELDSKGESAVLVLDELGLSGVRQSNTLKSLGLAAETLAGAVDLANVSWEENVALSEEANKRYDTTASKQAMMENAFNNLRIAIGDAYTPALRELYDVGTDLLVGATEFVEQNPALVNAVTAAVGVIGTATTAVATYKAGVELATAANKLFSTSIPGVGVIAGVTAGVAALYAAMATLADNANAGSEELSELTSVSREQYTEMQKLQVQYDELCASSGDTSYEAIVLKQKLDEATEAFESNRKTAEELAEAHRSIIDAHNELFDSYGQTIVEIDKQGASCETLVSKLEELMSVEDKSASVKQEILAVVELLNEEMPALGLAYDSYADSLNTSAKSIRAVIEAELERERQAANYENLKNAIAEESALYSTMTEAIAETTAAEEALRQAKEAMAQQQKNNILNVNDYTAAMDPYVKAVISAEEAVRNAKAAEEEAKTAYQENQEAINNLTATYADHAEGVDSSTEQILGAINSAMTEMDALAVEYQEVYDAALESIQGQYDIWDKAADVIATDTNSITASIGTQISYWQDYNDNLRIVGERSKDIDGLREMIGALTDGSAENVNAIAGMAAASDEDLAAMVKAWQELQAEQESLSETVAEVTLDYSTKIDELSDRTAEEIEQMDLSEDAAASARSTIQSYIDAAYDMLPSVSAAYASVAQTASKALNTGTTTNTTPSSPSSKSSGTSSSSSTKTKPQAVAAYAVGTLYAQRGWALVGEEGPELMFMNGGERIFTADESAEMLSLSQDVQAVVASPQLISAAGSSYGVSARDAYTTEAISEPVYAPASIQVVIQISGNATPDVIETLNMYGDEFAERVREVFEEVSRESVRRRY